MKMHLFLYANGRGSKLKPFVVFCGAKKGICSLGYDFKEKCAVSYCAHACMKDYLTHKCVKQVMGTFSFGRHIIV